MSLWLEASSIQHRTTGLLPALWKSLRGSAAGTLPPRSAMLMDVIEGEVFWAHGEEPDMDLPEW